MFPLFPLRQIVATSGALAALERAMQPLPPANDCRSRSLGVGRSPWNHIFSLAVAIRQFERHHRGAVIRDGGFHALIIL